MQSEGNAGGGGMPRGVLFFRAWITAGNELEMPAQKQRCYITYLYAQVAWFKGSNKEEDV